MVLPLLIRGTRRPSSACWPRAQDTCDWFTVDPFAPVVTISANVCRERERERKRNLIRQDDEYTVTIERKPTYILWKRYLEPIRQTFLDNFRRKRVQLRLHVRI